MQVARVCADACVDCVCPIQNDSQALRNVDLLNRLIHQNVSHFPVRPEDWRCYKLVSRSVVQSVLHELQKVVERWPNTFLCRLAAQAMARCLLVQL
jgi:hypothetical protein